MKFLALILLGLSLSSYAGSGNTCSGEYVRVYSEGDTWECPVDLNLKLVTVGNRGSEALVNNYTGESTISANELVNGFNFDVFGTNIKKTSLHEAILSLRGRINENSGVANASYQVGVISLSIKKKFRCEGNELTLKINKRERNGTVVKNSYFDCLFRRK